MPAKLIYLAGYSRQTLPTLSSAVNSLGVTMVDVRLTPVSRIPDFNRAALEAQFGARYVWLGEWGNLHHKSEQAWKHIQIKDFEAGLARFEAIDGPVMLLCACYDALKCHRHWLGNRLHPLGYEYKSLKLEEYAPSEDAPTLF